MAAKQSPVRPARKPPIAPVRKPPGTRRTRPRIRGVVLALVLVAGAAAAALSLLGGRSSAAAVPARPSISPDSMAVVETVDGAALPVREYELFLAQDRAETFAYFQQHYGVGDSATFWTTAHGGQTPTAYLEHAALADATNAVVQQVLATKYGVVSGFTYAGFLEAWQAQNASRAAALAAHQVIYGPTDYSESDYFTYVSDQMSEQLQTTLTGKGVIKPTDAALESYYNSHSPQFANTGGPVSFTQEKSVVQQYYVQAAYTKLVAQETKQAAVHVDQSVLAAISIG
jgi:hypothetical protein